MKITIPLCPLFLIGIALIFECYLLFKIQSFYAVLTLLTFEVMKFLSFFILLIGTRIRERP